MTKPNEKKKEKISVAKEIDQIEERRLICQRDLEEAEYKRRREQLSEEERQALEDEMTIITERIKMYERELKELRQENRKNMLLSLALLAVTALFYYGFIA